MKINVLGAITGAILLGGLAGACLPAGADTDRGRASQARAPSGKLAASETTTDERLSPADQRFSVAEEPLSDGGRASVQAQP